MNIIWKQNNKVINSPVSLGTLSSSDTSADKLITIEHDSNSSITECGLFIRPIKVNYVGSRFAGWDYDQLMWYANNYADYGLGIKQSYTTFGVIEFYDGTRIIDTTRSEPVNIFNQSTMEILDGSFAGETTIIDSYNAEKNLFLINTSFSGNVSGSRYKIDVENTNFVKKQQGSSREYPINLIYKGGVIERGDIVPLTLFLKVPNYSYAAANLLVDFNLKFFSTED